MIKKIAAAFLAVSCILVGTVSTASAQSVQSFIGNPVSPMYQIATYVSNNTYISGTTATCVSRGEGADTVKITVKQTLEKYWGLWIWTEVSGARWTKTVNDSYIYFSTTKSSLPNGKYRLRSEYTFTDSAGRTENITIYSMENVVGNG